MKPITSPNEIITADIIIATGTPISFLRISLSNKICKEILVAKIPTNIETMPIIAHPIVMPYAYKSPESVCGSSIFTNPNSNWNKNFCNSLVCSY